MFGSVPFSEARIKSISSPASLIAALSALRFVSTDPPLIEIKSTVFESSIIII